MDIQNNNSLTTFANLCTVRKAISFLALLTLVSINSSQVVAKTSSGENLGKRPNVIFIIADDMLPGMFNFLPQGKGKNLTPNIDRLAKEGVIMRQHYVASPVCTPSRYSCLTGRYASRARNTAFTNEISRLGQSVVGWNTFITSEDVTIGRLLQKAGYTTGFVGKDHVVEVSGLQTLEWEANPRDPEVAAKLKANVDVNEQAIRKCGFDYVENVYHNNPSHLGVKELVAHNVDWITKAGVDFIEANQETPFFLYFATTIPHGPADDKRSWNANPLITAEGYLEEPLDVLPARETIPARLKQAGLSTEHNKGNVLWLDDAVGALISTLEKHGLDDNTIIIFFNDHGQTAKGTLYQGGVLNPSVVWKKGGFGCGSECQVAVSNVDFAPTILDMVGADTSHARFDGRSFKPALEGDNSPIHDSLYFELGFTRAVMQDGFKYLTLHYPEEIQNITLEERQKILDEFNKRMKVRGRPLSSATASTPFSHIQVIPGGGDAERRSTAAYPAYYDVHQLYDLNADPNEQKNLASDPKYVSRLEDLQHELERYVTDLPGEFGDR